MKSLLYREFALFDFDFGFIWSLASTTGPDKKVYRNHQFLHIFETNFTHLSHIFSNWLRSWLRLGCVPFANRHHRFPAKNDSTAAETAKYPYVLLVVMAVRSKSELTPPWEKLECSGAAFTASKTAVGCEEPNSSTAEPGESAQPAEQAERAERAEQAQQAEQAEQARQAEQASKAS